MNGGWEIAPFRYLTYSEVPMSHRISIERNTLRFAAAHMATIAGQTEPLHGHNYDVIVEIDGALSEPDSWVIDFGAAKRIVRSICQELDHKFLLAARSPSLTARPDGASLVLESGDKRYVMPKSDVVELDIDNTTAERIAEWFASRIAAALKDAGAANLTQVTVGIEEMPGQTGWFTLRLGPERKISREL
jgi:6-pyruvoyltetrahydropterin/6-carboxytetrahydropterin synthase